MANTLTNLIPDAYVALDVVSRELTGFIPAVARNPSADRVALNQTLRAAQTPINSAGGDVTAAMSLPSASDQTIANKTVTISKSRYFPFSWTGEEQYSMDAGAGFLTIKQDQIAQAIRAAVNEMENDIASAVYKASSRAYGTAGTTPFASDLSEVANVRKILDDNGTPDSDRHMVINTTAGAKMRSLGQLTKANEAGSSDPMRRGVLLDVHGFMIRESAKVQSHTKGTGTSYQLNGAHSIGATTLAVDTGSGTIVAGDVITIANGTPSDSNKYVVTTALSGGNVVIAAPGLRCAHADNDAVTVGSDYSGNVAFRRNAVVLATRLPALPVEGDLALDREVITDPQTGISLELAAYPGYRMIVYQVLVSWGVSVIKPEHVATLLG